jgi:hypothetical protein
MTDERPRVALSDHQPHQSHARLAVLELYRASQGQSDRWVMVHVLQRKLPLEGPVLRAALDHAQSRGWVELDAKRARLLDLGRALIGRHPSPTRRHW